MLTLISIGGLLFTTIYVWIFNKDNRIKHYILLSFLLFWCVATILAHLLFLANYKINAMAYLLVALNAVSFCIGFSLVKWQVERNRGIRDDMLFNVNRLLCNIFFHIYIICLTAYMVSLFVQYLDMLLISSAAEMRTDFFSDEHNIYGSFFPILNCWVLKPTMYLLLVLLSLSFYVKKYFTSICSVIYILIYHTLGGGRFGYVQIAWSLFFVLVIVLNTVKLQVNKKTIGVGMTVILILYMLISGATLLRSSSMPFGRGVLNYSEAIKETNDHIVSYISAPIAALGYSLDNDYVNQMGGYSYGKLTFGSVDYFFNIVLSKIGINTERKLPKLAKIKQDDKICISDSNPVTERWNALYTSNLFFYLDFGLLGVIIMPLLFGYLFSLAIKKMLLAQTLLSLSLANYCFIQVMHSIFDFIIYDFSEFLIILVVSIIVNNSAKKYRQLQ